MKTERGKSVNGAFNRGINGIYASLFLHPK
jgi:hypothetical protein